MARKVETSVWQLPGSRQDCECCQNRERAKRKLYHGELCIKSRRGALEEFCYILLDVSRKSPKTFLGTSTFQWCRDRFVDLKIWLLFPPQIYHLIKKKKKRTSNKCCLYPETIIAPTAMLLQAEVETEWNVGHQQLNWRKNSKAALSQGYVKNKPSLCSFCPAVDFTSSVVPRVQPSLSSKNACLFVT